MEYASVLVASLRAGGAKKSHHFYSSPPFGLISGRVGSNLRVIRRVAQRIPPVEVVGGFSDHLCTINVQSSPSELRGIRLPLTAPPAPYLLALIMTLTRMQCPAIVGNAGNRKPSFYARFANPCNAQQLLTAHS
jgi:hypothetical protein